MLRPTPSEQIVPPPAQLSVRKLSDQGHWQTSSALFRTDGRLGAARQEQRTRGE
jgi:hypothetical protein